MDQEVEGGDMPSLSDLSHAERARLLGQPEGELGIALGEVITSAGGKRFR
jgi:hypothetical protein